MKKFIISISIIILLIAGVCSAVVVNYLSNTISAIVTISSPVVINEIGYREAHKDEFVELYNRGSVAIDLNHWRIQDNHKEDILEPFSEGESTTISAGGYAVITITADETDVVVPEGVVHLSTGDKKIGNGLADGGDIVILKSPDGKIMDQKGYSQNPCGGGEKHSYQKMNGDWECKVPSPGASNI